MTTDEKLEEIRSIDGITYLMIDGVWHYQQPYMDKPEIVEGEGWCGKDIVWFLQRCASLERVREAAEEAIRWASGTDKHWRAEGILSAELRHHEREWPKEKQ